jgi:hypothetical protein
MLVYEYLEEVEILELMKTRAMVCGFALEIREPREMVHRGIQLQDGYFEEGSREEVPALY